MDCNLRNITGQGRNGRSSQGKIVPEKARSSEETIENEDPDRNVSVCLTLEYRNMK